MADPFKASAKLDRIAALQKKLEALKTPIDQATSEVVGKSVIDEMKDMISKGISPVEGNGRFPAYLAQAKSNKAKKSKSSPGGAKKGYPYSVQGRFPSKRDRPVNLFLSGDFLNNLIFKTVRIKGSFSTVIGFFDELSSKKEQGHRDGVHGQPSRPVIPKSQEGFAQRIQRILFQIYQERVRLILNKD